ISVEDCISRFSTSLEKGIRLLTKSIISSLSFMTKKKVAKTTINCRNIVGKLSKTSEKEVTRVLRDFVINPEKTDPNSDEICSWEREGNMFAKVCTKSICCAAT